jgi:hypothetical protein
LRAPPESESRRTIRRLSHFKRSWEGHEFTRAAKSLKMRPRF